MTDVFKVFEVQDAILSGCCFLDVKPGMRMTYLCRCRWENTAYGNFDGKQRTTITMDLYESKLKQLKIRAKGQCI
jgi:16S rRNA (cytosine967-C5)-methyltransferase